MCRIGIIATHNIPDTPNLNIGEYIGERDKNENYLSLLYRLHKDLSYLYPFWGKCNVRNKCTEVVPTNLKDFIYLQDKYRLTKRIFIPKSVTNNLVQFKTPKLYDISCGVELFDDKIIKPVIEYPLQVKKGIIFVIPAYTDPISRGKSIDNALDMYSLNKDASPVFITLGGMLPSNRVETCKLSQRYLIRRKIPGKIIIPHSNNNTIKGALEVISTLGISNDNTIVYLSIKSSEMHRYLSQSRKTQKPFKMFFIDF